jgi:apolipoprotein N-acyltransferase
MTISLRKFRDPFFSILCSLLFTISFPGIVLREGMKIPYLGFILSLLGLVFFLKLIKRQSMLEASVSGVGFFLVFYFSLFYWVPASIQEFGNYSGTLSHIFGFVFFLINFGHYLILILLIKTSFISKMFKSNFLKNLILSFVVASLDYYYPQILSVHSGHIFHFLPSSLWPAIGGSAFLTFVTMVCILSFWDIPKKLRSYFALAFALTILSVESIDRFYFKTQEKNKLGEIAFSLIQPNIPNFAKLKAEIGDSEAINQIMTTLASLSRESTGLKIWPETSFPLTLPFSALVPSSGQHPLYEDILKTSTLIFGAYFEDDNKQTNSAILWANNSLQRYDKGFLKPFGERLPFDELFSGSLAKSFGLSYKLTEGKNHDFFKYNNANFVMTICYEILKPNYVRDLIKNNSSSPHFIVNLANDGWFSQTSQPYLHFFMNEWLSKQLNLPLLRAANTGVTGVTFPDGKSSLILPWYEKSVLNISIPYYDYQSTYFVQHGFLVTVFITLMLGSAYLLGCCMKKKGFFP